MLRRTVLLLIVVGINSCGKKSQNDSTPSYIGALAQGSDAMGYAIKVLASSNRASPGTTLANYRTDNILNDTSLDSLQDSNLPDCSLNGEPWDKSTNQRMATGNSKYAQTVFFCQVNSKQSPETLAGSLNQYKAMLCDVERVIGSITYTEDGSEYNDRSLSITEGCGWSAKNLEEMSGKALTANLTAYAINTGDWQKRVHVVVPAANFDFNLYFTIKSDFVGFKFVENWDQSKRMQGNDYNQNISATATGTRGSVVSVDPVNGILRAESSDTYWSRRFRFLIKGTLDGSSGLFSTVSDGQGIVSKFDRQTGLYSEIASTSGNDTEGFLYRAYEYSASNLSSVRTSLAISTSNSNCSKTGGCQGQTGITFSTDSSDLDFLMIGAVWDGQSGKRSNIESWLSGSGALTFPSISKTITP
jgi:hypothetical protein